MKNEKLCPFHPVTSVSFRPACRKSFFKRPLIFSVLLGHIIYRHKKVKFHSLLGIIYQNFRELPKMFYC